MIPYVDGIEGPTFNEMLVNQTTLPAEVFTDGFESGYTSACSVTTN